MIIAIALVLLITAFVSTLRAVTAASTERLLWGSLISSVCLGLAVQLRAGEYYGILMVAVFVVTDLMLYLFFRSLSLMPQSEPRHQRGDRIFRIFFFWLSLCAVAGIILVSFVPMNESVWVLPSVSAIAPLYSRVWSDDWLLTFLPVLGLVVLVAGGFFLVRREP